MVPDFPNKPLKEISRDSYIRSLTNEFNSSCQKVLIASGPLSGKTNFISQFSTYNQNQVVSYFINSNPTTQNLRTFLYVVCSQICRLLDKSSLPENIRLEELKSIYPPLSINLAEQAKKQRIKYFFAIDGLEWGLLGEKGNRIVDFQLSSFSGSPYILGSSNLDKVDSLPLEGFEIKKNVSHQFEFNLSDTEEYLSDLGLEFTDIKRIHEKAKGLPGYIKIVKDTIITSGKDWLKKNDLPNTLENLISRQLTFISENSPEYVTSALETISIFPKPISLSVLAKFLKLDENCLFESLTKTGIVESDENLRLIQISPEFTKDTIKSKLGSKKERLIGDFIQFLKDENIKDDLLLTMLMKEINDYKGISATLENDKLIATFSKNLDINSIIQQFHIASQMAYESKDILGLINWNLKLNIAKSIFSHALNFKEISALIAVGESKKALERVYTLPESSNKIRLLARAYSEMKEKGERISKNSIEELNVLISNQNFQEYDKGEIQALAIDLFPILPDAAVKILGNKFSQDDDTNIIESAIQAIQKATKQKQPESEKLELLPSQYGYFNGLFSKWLKDQSLINLINNIDNLENTAAKEFMIRQWCTENLESSELDQGIQLWIDTVVQDSSFSIPLRSLRKISGITKFVAKDYQKKLVFRLEIPVFNSLRTPWEEWVGFQLNLAEIISTHDIKSSKERIDKIYETINLDIQDLDIKVFCYARLWATVSKFYTEIEQAIKLNFERVLSSLLQNAALHDEILIRSLQIIAPIDVEYAMEKALEINTSRRRISAIKAIIKSAARKNSDIDLSRIIENVLPNFDINEQALFIVETVHEVWKRNIELNDINQATLLKYVRKIPDHARRADALGCLVVIWKNEKLIKSENLIKEMATAWSQESDLILRIGIGYNITERIAVRNKDAAREFCKNVQDLYLVPGGALASGDLINLYIQSIEAAVSSLNIRTISSSDEYLTKINNLIDRIPAIRTRIFLYGQLAARSYTEGYPKEAENLIRTKILPEIEKLDNIQDKHLVIKYCLPIIFKYHKQTALDLADTLPKTLKEEAWAIASIWSMTLGNIGREIDVEHLKVQSDYPTLNDYAIEALKNISEDLFIYGSVLGISKAIEQSSKSRKLDPTQAQTLLQILDELINEKLPDDNNIKHKGYLIIAMAVIHGARTNIYNSITKKGRLSSVDIRKKWDEIEKAAKSISNAADKVFVMQIVAKELYKYNDDRAVALLQEADNQINNIPTIIDRSDRLEEIGKAWGELGKKDLASYAIEKASQLIEQMGNISQGEKLELLVQAAYEFSPEFAEKLASKYDSRFPEEELNPLRIAKEIKHLSQNPEKILMLFDKNLFFPYILGTCADQLYKDLVSGRGRIPNQNILLEWIYQSSQVNEKIFFKVVRWVKECVKTEFNLSPDLPNIFIDLATLILKFTSIVSPAKHDGIPDEIMNILPGLNSKVTVFRTGEFEKARKWLVEWIRKSSEEYLKVVDPYFTPEQLIFFADIPKNCKLLVVSTDKYFRDYSSPERISAQLEHSWNQLGKGNPPQMILIIVPEAHNELFHDRVIITKNKGLDLGQSLNGLGNRTGKITDLDYEDAKELETKYVDDMLNNNSWFLNRDVQPTIVKIGF